MKSGTIVYTITVHAVTGWTFDRFHERDPKWCVLKNPSICDRSMTVKFNCPGVTQEEKVSHLYLSYTDAVRARIAMLQKTVRGLTTAAENHKKTIRKLQRQLRVNS